MTERTLCDIATDIQSMGGAITLLGKLVQPKEIAGVDTATQETLDLTFYSIVEHLNLIRMELDEYENNHQ